MKFELTSENPYGKLSDNRRIVPLAEICTEGDGIQTGPFGSQLHSADYVESGTPIIMVEHIGENTIKSDITPFVSDADVTRLRKYTMRAGDIIFSRVGYVDKRALVREMHEGWLFSGSTLRIRPDESLVDSTYLSYFFGYSKLKNYMQGVSVGATRPSINTGILKSIPIVLPELPEQKAIGYILSNLDKKIELNVALSKTLEDIAQTIFKSWFTDFDPVKAKMAGEKPVGMDAATAALFPDSMEDSELGLIPEGWEIVKVQTLLNRISVKGLPKSVELTAIGNTLVLEQGDPIVSGFINKEPAIEASVTEPKFIFGDHTCRMRLSTLPFSVMPNTIVLDSKTINTYWAYQATLGLQSFETYRRHWMELAYKEVIQPTYDLGEAFANLIRPMYEKMDVLMIESRYLGLLRDQLLPRLISGELQIPEEMLAS
jgi:type I restriction enzyme S subunit